MTKEQTTYTAKEIRELERKLFQQTNFYRVARKLIRLREQLHVFKPGSFFTLPGPHQEIQDQLYIACKAIDAALTVAYDANNLKRYGAIASWRGHEHLRRKAPICKIRDLK
jgi:hypothetical protein